MPNKAYYTEKELDKRGFDYKFYPADVDLRDLDITESTVIYLVKKLEVTEKKQGTKANTNTDENIKYEKGMSINKFLRANPKIRTVDDLSKYYSMDIINRAHKLGVFEIQRGKIKF